MIRKLGFYIALTESNCNRFSIRFEENYYKKNLDHKILEIIRHCNKCSRDTAKMIASTSWGQYQILGINLYSICEYHSEIGRYLCDNDLQYITFEKFIKKRVFTKNTKRCVENTLDAISHISLYYKYLDLKVEEKIEKLKSFLKINREAYKDLEIFILKYLGAKFLSQAFINYILRLIHYHNRIEEMIEKEIGKGGGNELKC